MFFLFLCIFLWALFALGVPFDKFGWLMIVALAWFCGFMDGRRANRFMGDGFQSDATMPPDMEK